MMLNVIYWYELSQEWPYFDELLDVYCRNEIEIIWQESDKECVGRFDHVSLFWSYLKIRSSNGGDSSGIGKLTKFPTTFMFCVFANSSVFMVEISWKQRTNQVDVRDASRTHTDAGVRFSPVKQVNARSLEKTRRRPGRSRTHTDARGFWRILARAKASRTHPDAWLIHTDFRRPAGRLTDASRTLLLRPLSVPDASRTPSRFLP